MNEKKMFLAQVICENPNAKQTVGYTAKKEAADVLFWVCFELNALQYIKETTVDFNGVSTPCICVEAPNMSQFCFVGNYEEFMNIYRRATGNDVLTWSKTD